MTTGTFIEAQHDLAVLQYQEQHQIRSDDDADSATVVGDYGAATNEDAVQAYAKLEFADGFSYYMRSLEIVLGRKTGNMSMIPSDAGGENGVDVHLGSLKAISRKHALLFYNYETQQFELKVLGKNGLFVGESFYEKDVMIPMVNGSQVRIGEASFIFLLPRTDEQDEDESQEASHEVDDEEILKDDSYDENMVHPVDDVMRIADDFGAEFPDMEAVAKSIGLTTEQKLASEHAISDFNKRMNGSTAPAYPSNLNNKDTKPPFTYASLIAQAVNASPSRKVTLNGIYDYIQSNYPYYLNLPEWQSVQNSIRHNLSLNKAFIKVPRMDNEPGKGAFWTIDPNYENQFENGIYKKAKRTVVKKGTSFSSVGFHSFSQLSGNSKLVKSSNNIETSSIGKSQTNGKENIPNGISAVIQPNAVAANPHLPFSLGPQGQLIFNPVLLRYLSSITLDQLQYVQNLQAAEAIKWLENHLEPDGGLVVALAKAMAAAAAAENETKKAQIISDKVQENVETNLHSPKVHAHEMNSPKNHSLSNAQPGEVIREVTEFPAGSIKTVIDSGKSQSDGDADDDVVVDVLGDDDGHPSSFSLVESMLDESLGSDEIEMEVSKRMGTGGKGRGGKGKGKSVPQSFHGGKSRVPGLGGKSVWIKKPSIPSIPATLSSIDGKQIRPIMTTRKRKMTEDDEDVFVDIDG